MKSKLAFSLVFFITNFYSQSIDNAMKYYQSKEYSTSMINWEKNLEKVNANQANIHFQIGNCCLHNKEFPKAIFHYEKSLKLDYNQSDVKFNLNIARAKSGLDTENKLIFVQDWARKLAYLFPYHIFKWILIFGSILFLILAIILYSKPTERIATAKNIVFWTSILLYILFFGQRYFRSESNSGIIDIDAIGYDNASQKGKTKILKQGDKVMIIDELGEQIQVQLESDSSYWVTKTSIMKI